MKPSRENQKRRRRASTSLVKAKDDFTTALQKAMKDLMEKHGYSRERATAALLREISGSIVVDEGKVLDVMRRFALGNQQAVQALSVAASVDKLTEEMSMTQALQKMTEKLLNVNVSSPDEEKETMETKEMMTETKAPCFLTVTTTTATSTSVTNSASSTASSHEKRPYTSKQPQQTQQKSSKAAKQKPTKTTLRARADSVPEEVSVKLAATTAAPKSTPQTCTTTVPTATPRNKRSRSEDEVASVVKRARSNA